jgi:hypothetical protein
VPALLAALLAALTLTVAAAGPAVADPIQTCTPWTRVSTPADPEDDGYVNDRHGQVYPEIQHCSATPGGPLTQWYGRVVYHQYSADKWSYQPAGITMRLFEYSGGCYGCVVIVQTDRAPEPGVGNSRVSGGRGLLLDNGLYGVDVVVSYVNPPNPSYFQTGVFTFDNPY